MKKNQLILLLLLAFTQLSFSNIHYKELYEQGNTHYEKGEYQEAVDTYRKIIQSNFQSSELLFNLGNAYFKLNKIPLSILYYEKAKKLAPDDPDVLFNLEFANQRIVDKISPIPKVFYLKWWNSFVYITAMDTWAVWGLGLFSLAFLFMVVFLFIRNSMLKRISFWSGVLLICCALVAFGCALQQKKQLSHLNEGIVFSPTVTVKSSPDINGKELFVIHEGLKVFIKETVNDWHRIVLPDGNEGWLQTSDIEII